ERRGAVLDAPLDVEVAGPGVRAADDVTLVPVRAEADVDGEGNEGAPRRVARRAREKRCPSSSESGLRIPSWTRCSAQATSVGSSAEASDGASDRATTQ